MVEIGKFNRLRIAGLTSDGAQLDGGQFGAVKISTMFLPSGCKADDWLEVFVYLNSDEQLVATTDQPKAQVGECAWLEVVDVNNAGAFLDWGLPKDLLVPYSEQRYEMEVGRSYLVSVFLDPETQRIAASTRLDNFVDDEAVAYKTGQAVDALITDKTDIGYKAVVDHRYWGLLYDNEVFRSLKRGQRITAYIKKQRSDNRLDISLYQPGYEKVDAVSRQILDKLAEHDGFLLLTDKSPPEAIYAVFGISKKVYKKAVGGLYKKRLITIEPKGIRLLSEP